VRVHLAREHAPEFEFGHALPERRRIALELGETRRVFLGLDQVEEFARVSDSPGDGVEFLDRAFQTRPLAAELLRAPWRVPDARVFQLAVYFLEPLALAVVLKDTPSAR
jgi:hypothetical protein